MRSLELIGFEIKKQVKSINFIILFIVLILFITSQMSSVFHLPIKNTKDIQYIKSQGETNYLYVNASDEELVASTIDYLNRMKAEVNADTQEAFTDLIKRIEEEGLSFDQAYKVFLEGNPNLIYWLDVSRDQFSTKVGSMDEVNSNLKDVINKEGYEKVFIKDYVTYMQLIISLCILPLLIMLFTKDYKCKMNEIISVQPISYTKYILSKYSSCIIVLLGAVYVIGMIMNLYSVYRFSSMGWHIKWVGFSKYFIVYIVPTVIFLSSLVMFLIILLRRAVAAFPIYIFYVIFNATQSAFLGHADSNALYKVIVRLDNAIPYNNFVMINRILYLILGIILIIFSCKLYKYSNEKFRRGISL